MKNIQSLRRQLFRTTLLFVAVTLSGFHAIGEDSVKQIRQDFETLTESFSELKEKGSEFRGEVAQMNNYLNELISTPDVVAGRSWTDVADTLSEMSDEEFDSLLNGNKDSMQALVAEDDVVRSNVDEIGVKTDEIVKFLDDAVDQLATMNTDAMDLATRISDYIDEHHFSAVRLSPLVFKSKGLISDIGELAQVVPETLKESAIVATRIGRVQTAVDDSIHDPNPNTAPEPPSDEPIETANESDGRFKGQWQEVDAGEVPVMMFLGAIENGESRGMVAATSYQVQASIELEKFDENQCVYKDRSTGNLFSVTPFEEQIILKHYKPDGTKIFQLFMERQ